MRRFNNYQEAEQYLIDKIIQTPDFITKTTSEIICDGFILTDPLNNENNHSNYEYAHEFFKWLLTGETELSSKIKELNPWAERFTAKTNLPESFSSSYGKKIKDQLDAIIEELANDSDSRRAYINILIPEDKVILRVKTTHEFPCTIGLHFFIRDNRLQLITQMRSNNVYSVMPYDVYNFTMLQNHISIQLGVELGEYYHQINSAHLYKGDIKRILTKTI